MVRPSEVSSASAGDHAADVMGRMPRDGVSNRGALAGAVPLARGMVGFNGRVGDDGQAGIVRYAS